MSRTVAMIQARMSSTRFPGKVLQPLAGRPMIVLQAERARRSRMVDEVVVVTSTEADDDPLVEELAARGLLVFRGALDDVLGRFAKAANEYNPALIVRLTGDCPFTDPKIIDDVLKALTSSGADYASNVDPPTYPDGLDVEAFTREALDLANRQARSGPDREHVTLWMRSDEAGLKRVCHRLLVDMSDLRLTVDYPDDHSVVESIVDALGTTDFDLFDVLRQMDRDPQLLLRNRHWRNEALLPPAPPDSTGEPA